MKYNINDMVTVCLTENGAKVLRGNPETSNRSSWKSGDMFTTELWFIMQTFGPYIHLGGDKKMFQANLIDIKEEGYHG